MIRKYVWRALAAGCLLPAAFHLSGQATGSPFQIVTDSLPAATVGTSYFQLLAVSGGTCTSTGTASSRLDAGALPAGLVIISPPGGKQWAIQGTPLASGTFRFTVHLVWTHAAISPFDQACLDEAVKALTLTVQAPLTVDRTQITTTYHTAHLPPAAEAVQVTSGTAPVRFTAQATTNSGVNWLSVSPQSGTTPAALSISFSISGLAPGVYAGKVTVAGDMVSPVVIAVTLMVVTDATLVLQASPASLSFSNVAGGQAPPSQSLAVSVSGDAVIFQADVTVTAPPNGKWLSISPTGALTPARLDVSVDPKDLSPGVYSGTINLRVAGSPNSTQTIPVTFTIQKTPAPAISPNGVANAANLTGAISPGTWVSIFGANLSDTTRSWRDADFVNGKLPSALDGVGVTINGKAAPVAFISPSQVNVLAPDDTTTGLVFVQVKSPAGTSENGLVLEQTAAPAFFQFRAGTVVYVAGTHADGSYLAGAGLVQQGIPGTPARPGETIVVFGTGFGATQPAISATALVPSALALANPQDLRVRIGGVAASIAFAGLISPGVYQFNVVVPQVDDGDQPIVAELRGLLTAAATMLPVQH